jgi:hypothetical protein
LKLDPVGIENERSIGFTNVSRRLFGWIAGDDFVFLGRVEVFGIREMWHYVVWEYLLIRRLCLRVKN